MLGLLRAEILGDAHHRLLVDGKWPGLVASLPLADAWRWIHANHRCNALLWQEEDKARRRDVADAEIAAGKRLIDGYNQQRNDAVEAIDEAILAMLRVPLHPDAWLSSETAGAMIDRLSILALKIHHMRQQTRRRAVAPTHVLACEAKLRRLVAQRRDLAYCFRRRSSHRDPRWKP